MIHKKDKQKRPFCTQNLARLKTVNTLKSPDVVGDIATIHGDREEDDRQ